MHVVKSTECSKNNTMSPTLKRMQNCIASAIPASLKTSLWLLKIMLPISLGVRLLDFYGVLEFLSVYLHPLFQTIGLPGHLAIVFVTSVFVSPYATIAVMSSLSMTVHEATLLSGMCLIAHNMLVECAVTKKTGSSFIGMFLLRIFMAFAIAFILNLALTPDNTPFILSQAKTQYSSLVEIIQSWVYSSVSLILILVSILTLLMIIQRILIEFQLMSKITKPLAPFMVFLGLPKHSSILWIVGNVIGLAYGGAIMIEMLEKGEVSKQESNLMNYHFAMSHSLLEDSILFASIGVYIIPIMIVRLVFAFIVVWLKRLSMWVRKEPLCEL